MGEGGIVPVGGGWITGGRAKLFRMLAEAFRKRLSRDGRMNGGRKPALYKRVT
jgi:hypothetical protein